MQQLGSIAQRGASQLIQGFFDSGQIAEGLIGGFSIAIGNIIGGGGEGAAIGSTLGYLVGAYFGSGEIGAIIGGAIGGLFDEGDEPRGEVVNTATAPGPNAIEVLTPFGPTFVPHRRRWVPSGAQQVADTLAQFDDALASFLTDSQIEAVAEALRGFGRRSGRASCRTRRYSSPGRL